MVRSRSGKAPRRCRRARSTRCRPPTRRPRSRRSKRRSRPLMSAHQDSIELDAQLYWRIKTIHEQLDELELEPEQRYLVERHFREMTHAGAGLDETRRRRLTALNQRLSTLTTTFEKNLLADTNDLAVVFDDVAELDGLTEGELSAAAQAARRPRPRGQVARHPHAVHRASVPRLAHEPRRAASGSSMPRARADRAATTNDNRDGPARDRAAARRAGARCSATTACRVRHRRRDGRLARGGARPARRLAAPAARNARREQAALQAIIDAEPEPFALEAHDWAFYTEKVRAAEYDLDRAALRPWFEAERVLQDGVFHAADRALRRHLHRARRPAGLPPRRARLRGAQRRRIAARAVRPRPLHARHQARRCVDELDRLAVAPARHRSPSSCNNLNVPKPAPGKPTLLTSTRSTTLFHEFGHALHGLFATRHLPAFRRHERLPRLRRVPEPGQRDVDLLARDPRALCARTSRPASRCRSDVVDEAHASEAFNQGFAHERVPRGGAGSTRPGTRSPPTRRRADIDVAAFEAAALADIGLDNPVGADRGTRRPTSRTSSRAATARGYYSYIWSEVLDADTVEWFRENGGLTRGERRPLPRPPARRRRVEGPARGLPRLPRAGCRHPAAARAPRARGLSRPSQQAERRARSLVRAAGQIPRGTSPIVKWPPSASRSNTRRSR